MANTYVDYTATAAQQYFAFNFPYLEDDHVIVEIEGVDQTITTNYTIETSPSQRINLSNPTTALAGGELVRIKRRSAPNTNLVDFQNGSVLTESELDRAYLHNRYLAEEATEGADSGLKELEGSTNYNAGNKQIKNLADGTLATDAVNKGYVDTQIALTDTNLAGFYKSTHTGNAVDNVFTLSFTPQTTDAKAYIVSIDGLVQVPDTDYTIGATAITFNTIPANSAEICVVATAAASVATVNEAQVTATGSTTARSLADRFVDVVNVLDFIPTSEHAAIKNGTTTYDAIDDIEDARDAGNALYFPAGVYKISRTLTLNKEGFRLFGESQNSSLIAQDLTQTFTGDATIDINGARLQSIENLYVTGQTVNGTDAIRITNGQLASITNVKVKFGESGVKLIAGNNQKWTNVTAESCNFGFVVDPSASDDTNGCVMQGLRAYSSREWGLEIKAGAGPNGHMHSSWDISAEGATGGTINGGIKIRGGRYNHFILYAESNAGDELDLEGSANWFFIKNPDNDVQDALFNPASLSTGYNTVGGNIYFDRGIAPERYAEVAYSVSGSLVGQGTTMFDITNTSGSTRTLTLSILSSMPAGFRFTVTKRDNTHGFTLLAPITLTGDTGTFGAFPTSVKKLEVMKINATTAVCIQSGS
jgi:hypothetical protein